MIRLDGLVELVLTRIDQAQFSKSNQLIAAIADTRQHSDSFLLVVRRTFEIPKNSIQRTKARVCTAGEPSEIGLFRNAPSPQSVLDAIAKPVFLLSARREIQQGRRLLIRVPLFVRFRIGPVHALFGLVESLMVAENVPL